MDLRELAGLVSRLSYKKGHLFNLMPGWITGPMLRMRLEVKDIDRPGEQCFITYTHPVPEGWQSWTESDALRWFQSFVLEWEEHERDEWLQIDGLQIKPPHEKPAYVPGTSAPEKERELDKAISRYGRKRVVGGVKEALDYFNELEMRLAAEAEGLDHARMIRDRNEAKTQAERDIIKRNQLSELYGRRFDFPMFHEFPNEIQNKTEKPLA